MDAELGKLLGYLEQEGVTELVLGSGQPITVRRGGAYTAASTDIVSRPQLARWLLGSGFEGALPDDEGIGEPADIDIGAKRYAVQISRRGDDLLVRVEKSRNQAPDVPPPRTLSRSLRRPTLSPPATMQTSESQAATPSVMPGGRPVPPPAVPSYPTPPPGSMAAVRPAQVMQGPPPVAARTPIPRPPSPDVAAINPPSVLELGPPDVALPPGATASADDHYSMLPDLMPDGPLAMSMPQPPERPSVPTVPLSVDPSRRAPTPPPVAAEPARPARAPTPPPVAAEPARPGRAPTPTPVAIPMSSPGAGSGPISGSGSGSGSMAEPARPARAPTPIPVTTPAAGSAIPVSIDALRSSPIPQAVAMSPSGAARAPGPGGADGSIAVDAPRTTTKTPPSEGPVARGPRTRSADASPVPAPPPARATTPNRDEKPNTDLIAQVVRAARQRGASDLHVSANRPLLIRAIGELIPLDRTPITATDAEKLLMPLLGLSARERLAQRGYVDLAIDIPGAGRLRGNISKQQGGLKGSFRLAYPQPPTLEELHLPKDLAKVVSHHQGLVVIAGPSGHGKTTTLAALVDLINSSRPHHILTIEDPVEIEHPRKRAVVTQREVGRHTKSFAAALKASLREDPDVIVIGELRDRETVEIALTAAETGHLVMATMSTPSAAKTIDRLIDMFPPDEQAQVRASLGGALRAIVAQRLVPRIDNGALLPAVELLTGVLPLIALIRDNKLFQLPNLMQRGRAFGMIRLDDSLAELVRGGYIAEDVALRVADNKRDLLVALKGTLATAPLPPATNTSLPPRPASQTSPPPGGTAVKKGGLGGLFGRKDRE